MRQRRLRWVVVALSIILLVGVAAQLAYNLFGVLIGVHDQLLIDVLYNGALMAAGLIPLVQMVRRTTHRAVYGLFGAAILMWASGDLYWTLALQDLEAPPFPSLADAGWLAFYPLAYAALILIIRARVVHFMPSLWLDGLIAVLTCAAFAAALVIGPILSGVGGTMAQIATNVAYPIGDLLLVLLVLLAISLGGWKIDRQLAMLGGGLVIFAFADSIYLYRTAAETYVAGGLLDSLWLVGTAVISFALLFDFREPKPARYEGWSVVIAPALFALGALGLLTYDAVADVPVAVPLLALAALVVAFIRAGLTFRDVQALADARAQATTDDLTGLPNRRWIIHELDRLTSSDDTASCALTIIDLNGFKEVNDTLGHQAGDAVLTQMGARMSAVVDGLGRVGRLGGDEFAVITPDIDAANTCAARIGQALGDGFPVEGLTLSVTARMGTAAWPAHAQDSRMLLRCADIALYSAKDARLPSVVYDSYDDQHSIDSLILTSDLRTAIADEKLTLVYQPKISLASGEVVGVEALARWHHPTHGSIPPLDFVALAEAGGLMPSLTRLVLGTAIRQVRCWLDSGEELPIAVNISPSDLFDASFCTTVEDLLREHDVPARFLQLEVTETELIADSDRTMATIDGLAKIGVRIALDDFGTGYSSLRYLHDLRFHELKIDRGFVSAMASQQGDAAIVRCAIDMASAFDMTVVAEGVEDHETVTLLADYGCGVAQGYHISRPLPPADLEAWLTTRRTVLV